MDLEDKEADNWPNPWLIELLVVVPRKKIERRGAMDHQRDDYHETGRPKIAWQVSPRPV
jgi:hypothetical protein